MATKSDGNTDYMNYSGGTYSTPDRKGFIEWDEEGKEWYAWREDIEGVTAHFDRFDEAVSYAWYGDGPQNK